MCGMSSPCTNIKPPDEDFLATVLRKMRRQVELKNNEIKKVKRGYFVVKAIRPRDVP